MLRNRERMEGGNGENTAETDHDSSTHYRGPNMSETDLGGGGSGCVTSLKALSLQLPCTQLM